MSPVAQLVSAWYLYNSNLMGYAEVVSSSLTWRMFYYFHLFKFNHSAQPSAAAKCGYWRKLHNAPLLR